MLLYNPNIPFAGLSIAGSRDSIPRGALRRARGVHSVVEGSLKSRWGSTLVTALNSHSLFRYADARFQGSGVELYRNGISIDAGYDGSKLAFVKMQPSLEPEVAGTETGEIHRLEGSAPVSDYLFVAGGNKMRKVDSLGAVTNWGIVAPPDGFLATKQAALFKTIDNFDDAASWTAAGAGVTLTDEGSIKQEGTNAMKMLVPASIVGEAKKNIVIDLSIFGAGQESALEDFISIWCRVDNPSNLEYLQVLVDVEDNTFNVNSFSRTVPILADIASSAQLVEQTIGIGSVIDIAESAFMRERDENDTDSFKPLSEGDFSDLLNNLSQGHIIIAQNVWVKLRIPKRLFTQTGPIFRTWKTVKAVKLIAKTNSRGPVNVYWDLMGLEGGSGMAGTYQYRVTFRNSVSGSRSNANPTAVEVQNVTRQSVRLHNLPVSADLQVDQREIWRTVGNGQLFFRVAVIDDNATVEFIDDVSDFFGMNNVSTEEAMQSIELPLDNDPPEITYDDAVGPFVGRMWWCRDSLTGRKGRLYYSPVGRPEAVEGFINVTSDDDPTQKAVIWNTQLFVLTEGKVFRILGQEPPFQAIEVSGARGTNAPFTVEPTPFGIFYKDADNSISVFDGVRSILAAFEPIYPILRGESVENLTPFQATDATFGKNEYLVTDGVQTLALNLMKKTWRDLGVGCNALYYEDDSGEVVASIGNKTVVLEDEGTVQDDGVAIPFEAEFASVLGQRGQQALTQMVFVDLDTDGQLLTPTLIIDNATVVLPVISAAVRTIVELPVERSARVIGLRLTGNLSARVEIFSVEADIHAAGSTDAAAAAG